MELWWMVWEEVDCVTVDLAAVLQVPLIARAWRSRVLERRKHVTIRADTLGVSCYEHRNRRSGAAETASDSVSGSEYAGDVVHVDSAFELMGLRAHLSFAIPLKSERQREREEKWGKHASHFKLTKSPAGSRQAGSLSESCTISSTSVSVVAPSLLTSSTAIQDGFPIFRVTCDPRTRQHSPTGCPAGKALNVTWSGAEMQGRRKREFPEKTYRQAASSSTIPTCENLAVSQPGIETRWEAGALATAPQLPQ
ncbi:hypothetical protein PR048_027474 [Dryococelus australis]|uniref:Uncharacterized protein n=1 Tax=Dryococelus australis TaxID=614101 RepID=A0ABQ9GGJ1_9NEOP|nr:hypothetical protein PR048_027474 [Dryococelus australis]